MNLNAKRLFLADSCGAAVSAILLGFVLTGFQTVFGMPSHILYLLAVIACALAIFSFLSYLLVNEKQKIFLKIIAGANLLYGTLTTILLFYFYNSLTGFGLLYFIAELIVITGFALLEWKTASGLAIENRR